MSTSPLPPARSWSVFSTLVVLLILVLSALVFLLAPLGIAEAQTRWFWYKNRNNSACVYHEDCLSMNCPAPNGVFCHWREVERKGICVCRRWGLMRENMVTSVPTACGGVTDAGAQVSEERDH